MKLLLLLWVFYTHAHTNNTVETRKIKWQKERTLSQLFNIRLYSIHFEDFKQDRQGTSNHMGSIGEILLWNKMSE